MRAAVYGFGGNRSVGRSEGRRLSIRVHGSVEVPASSGVPESLTATWRSQYQSVPPDGDPEIQAAGEVQVTYRGYIPNKFGRVAIIGDMTDPLHYSEHTPGMAESLVLGAISRMPRDGIVRWNVPDHLREWALARGFTENTGLNGMDDVAVEPSAVSAQVHELRSAINQVAPEVAGLRIRPLWWV